MSVKTIDEYKCIQLVSEWNEGGNGSKRLFRACGAATGKARSPRVDLCTGGRQALVLWTTVDDGGFPRRLSDECYLRGMPALTVEAAVCQNAETECYSFRNPQPVKLAEEE